MPPGVCPEGRCIGVVILDFFSFPPQRVREHLVVEVQGGLCEQTEVYRVSGNHGDDVHHGGTESARLLGVECYKMRYPCM